MFGSEKFRLDDLEDERHRKTEIKKLLHSKNCINTKAIAAKYSCSVPTIIKNHFGATFFKAKLLPHSY
jgi:hypothetical protein